MRVIHQKSGEDILQVLLQATHVHQQKHLLFEVEAHLIDDQAIPLLICLKIRRNFCVLQITPIVIRNYKIEL